MQLDRMRGYEDDGFVISDSDSDTEWLPKSGKRKLGGAKGKRKETIDLLATKVLEASGKGVVGRSDEVNQILSLIEQPKGGVRPLLLGPAGIGRGSIVKKVAHVMHDRGLVKRDVYCINAHEVLSGSPDEERPEALQKTLAYFLNKEIKPLIYIKGIDHLWKDEKLKNVLSLFFATDLPFTASFEEEDQKITQQLSAHRFYPIAIKEVSVDETLEITRIYLTENPLNPKLQFSNQSIELGVRLSAKYETGRPLPMRAITSIQEAANQILLRKPSDAKIPFKREHMADYFSQRTGIAVADLLDGGRFNQERFSSRLKEEIVGQDHAVEIVSQQVAVYKMGLLNPDKPWGAFLFVGPTGVGKTELAKMLAKELFKDERSLVRLDGTEFKEDYTVSNLIGSPQGYEGHQEGGRLTEALLKNPHQVVLFDEFEKAHPDVRRLFMQVFDYGRITDRRGRSVDCTQTLFIMTSNLGSQELLLEPEADVIKVLEPILVKELSPELVNRFSNVIPFQPLKKENLRSVAEVYLKKMQERISKQSEIRLSFTESFIHHLCNQTVDFSFGMRRFCQMIDKIVVDTLKNGAQSVGTTLSGKVILDANEGVIQLKIPRKK